MRHDPFHVERANGVPPKRVDASCLPTMEKPLCFISHEAFTLWRMAGRGLKGDNNDYCYDCNPEYQRAMLQANRCEHPGVIFVKRPDGEMHGQRPAPK